MAAPPSSQPDVPSTADQLPSKPIHSLVLDTGPLVKNDPPADVLRAKAEQLYMLPSVIPEIRDPATRSRVETTLLPFITVRAPKPDSIKFITAFARRTGDLAVLSKPDIEVLALGYELECERNGGDWRLRNTPGQKALNGRPNNASAADVQTVEEKETAEGDEQTSAAPGDVDTAEGQALDSGMDRLHLHEAAEEDPKGPEGSGLETNNGTSGQVAETVEVDQPVEDGEKNDETVESQQTAEETRTVTQDTPPVEVAEEEESDDEGWITPSNLKKHQAQDAGTSTPAQAVQKTLQAAVLTSDYAMQNVALRMNLNLVAPSLARITQLKTWVLRCHGCFQITKDTTRQFCPSCGQATLTRASCSTDQHGNFRVHLKKNYQWNNRGNVYSVPKPVHGSTNGRRLPGRKNAQGGQGGWGTDLILAEDQKEFVRAGDEQRRMRKKDIMDEDVLPGILSGERSGTGGKIKVGAGRNVNSRRKHK